MASLSTTVQVELRRALAARANYGGFLYGDTAATFEDLQESLKMLEETERTARRVLGGQHPFVLDLGRDVRAALRRLRARETPSETS